MLTVYATSGLFFQKEWRFAPFALSFFLLAGMQRQWQELKQPPQTPGWKPWAEEGTPSGTGHITGPDHSQRPNPLAAGIGPGMDRCGRWPSECQTQGFHWNYRGQGTPPPKQGKQPGHEPGAVSGHPKFPTGKPSQKFITQR